MTPIPKEGNDKEDIANYQPIALLIVDYKIFAKVIAERFRKILLSIIHSDQNGFFPKKKFTKEFTNNFECAGILQKTLR